MSTPLFRRRLNAKRSLIPVHEAFDRNSNAYPLKILAGTGRTVTFDPLLLVHSISNMHLSIRTRDRARSSPKDDDSPLY